MNTFQICYKIHPSECTDNETGRWRGQPDVGVLTLVESAVSFIEYDIFQVD